jgi:hypothetical protein
LNVSTTLFQDWIWPSQLNIRRVSQEIICQPLRTTFKKMHVDVEVCRYWCSSYLIQVCAHLF